MFLSIIKVMLLLITLKGIYLKSVFKINHIKLFEKFKVNLIAGQNISNYSCYQCMDYGCESPVNSSLPLVFIANNCSTGCFVSIFGLSIFFK